MELLDIYDRNGIKTGRQVARGTWISSQEYLLVAHLCIFDSQGRMLIQRRSPDKGRWGGLWDFTVGGHVRAGENSRRAILREAREELGLNVQRSIRFAVRVKIPQVFDDFFLLRENLDLGALKLQVSEVSEVRWASWIEVLELIESGAFVGYELSLVSNLFLYGQNMPQVRTRRNAMAVASPSEMNDVYCLAGT